LIVDLGQSVANGIKITVSVVGLRNPDTDSVTFNVLAMYASTGTDDLYLDDSAKYRWSITETLVTHAVPTLELYRVTTPEGESNRALASSDNYKFYFGVAFDEDTTGNQVEMLDSKGSKFFVFFPPEY
jgi:hypothetical protein